MKSLKNLIKQFKNPSKEYGVIPFWFWNDDLKEDNLLFQMKEMKEKGIDEFLIHARRGLSVPYLSEEWFKKVEFTLVQAEKLDMYVWLYDEENWPSGYAGGKVINENFDFCGKYIKRLPRDVKPDGDLILLATDDDYSYYKGNCLYHPAYSDSYYVDMLNKKSTECFIKITHEEYYKRFKKYFGNRIKGFFVDEPGFYNNFEMYGPCDDAGTYTWATDFPEQFKKIKGYDILSHIGCLWQEQDKSKLKVRLDYYDVLAEMFRENFLMTLKKWCNDRDVKLIGHLHNEEFMPYHVKCLGDMMTDLKCLDYSGVDRIDCNTQKLTEKYGSSSQHIYQTNRTMSETFCFSGWDLNSQKMRFLTNYQYVRGVNLLVPHAFFSSIEGDRKWECPPTLFYHNHYWKYFKQYTDYVKRLSATLTQGDYTAPVAVFYPISTIQELVKSSDLVEAKYYDRIFIDACNALLEEQIDFELLNDDGIDYSQIDGDVLNLNDCKYRAIALIGVLNIKAKILRKIVSYSQAGGRVIFVGDFEAMTCSDLDEYETEKLKEILTNGKFLYINKYWYRKPYTYEFDGIKISAFLKSEGLNEVCLQERDSDIRYMHRSFNDADFYFFTNESDAKKKFTVSVRSKYNKVYALNYITGKLVEFGKNDGKIRDVVLQPSGEIGLICTDAQIQSNSLHNKTLSREVAILDNWCISLAGEQINGKLKVWSDFGKGEYSGFAEYTTKINLTIDSTCEYELDLGKVLHTAEVYINGTKVKDLIFAPFVMDITKYLKSGDNDIKVIVSNTLGNEIEKYPYPSGLLGEVKIIEKRIKE